MTGFNFFGLRVNISRAHPPSPSPTDQPQRREDRTWMPLDETLFHADNLAKSFHRLVQVWEDLPSPPPEYDHRFRGVQDTRSLNPDQCREWCKISDVLWHWSKIRLGTHSDRPVERLDTRVDFGLISWWFWERGEEQSEEKRKRQLPQKKWTLPFTITDVGGLDSSGNPSPSLDPITLLEQIIDIQNAKVETWNKEREDKNLVYLNQRLLELDNAEPMPIYYEDFELEHHTLEKPNIKKEPGSRKGKGLEEQPDIEMPPKERVLESLRFRMHIIEVLDSEWDQAQKKEKNYLEAWFVRVEGKKYRKVWKEKKAVYDKQRTEQWGQQEGLKEWRARMGVAPEEELKARKGKEKRVEKNKKEDGRKDYDAMGTGRDKKDSL